jgi:membrane-associated phospholipid phosphatase
MNKVALVISWLFLPLFAPVYALLITMYTVNFEPDAFQENCLFVLIPEQKKAVLSLFFIFSFVGPAISVILLRFSGQISTVMMDKRSERMVPSIMTNLFGISLLSILLWKMDFTFPGARYLFGLAAGSCTTVLICTIITRKWKISLHAAGMGILCGFLYAYFSRMGMFNLYLFSAIILLSGIVMSARYWLGAHSLKQLGAGFLVGSVNLVFFCWLFQTIQK